VPIQDANEVAEQVRRLAGDLDRHVADLVTVLHQRGYVVHELVRAGVQRVDDDERDPGVHDLDRGTYQRRRKMPGGEFRTK
jgi:hypothetical protein